MRIGITGQSGFVGKHLYNFLGLQEGIELIPFEKDFFEIEGSLQDFVSKCDTVVHLAAMNRHEDQQVIYDTNVGLVQKLIETCKKTESTPHILISSSTQEHKENLYGQSKRDGRTMLEAWAIKCGATSTGLIIPNVFGPFGKPFYNSFIATFCHQIALGEEPKVLNDAEVELIYVNDLVEEIYDLITTPIMGKVNIGAKHKVKVSKVLEKLMTYRNDYMYKGVFPTLGTPFDLALFNSFRCYIPDDHYPQNFTKHTDERGSFVEIVRANTSGQFSYSTTKPGITRGNHFHTRKAERFSVIKGKAKISVRKIDSDKVIDYIITGDSPAYVDMPIWHTHNITNIGEEEMIALFWINEPYDPGNPDTYFVKV